MRVTELDPQFRLWRNDHALGKTDNIIEAQGITIECPVCTSRHWILVWFANRNVPAEAEPIARWHVSGTGYNDLTITPSINAQVNDPKCWHGFITNGEIK